MFGVFAPKVPMVCKYASFERAIVSFFQAFHIVVFQCALLVYRMFRSGWFHSVFCGTKSIFVAQ